MGSKIAKRSLVCLCTIKQAHEVNLLIIPRGVKMCPSKLCQMSFTEGLKRDKTLLCHTKISALFSALLHSLTTKHFLYSHHTYTIPSILCSILQLHPFYFYLFSPLNNKQWTLRVKIKSNFRGHIKISLDRRFGWTEWNDEDDDEFSLTFSKVWDFFSFQHNGNEVCG